MGNSQQHARNHVHERRIQSWHDATSYEVPLSTGAPHVTFKIVLLGDLGSGKTSLCRTWKSKQASRQLESEESEEASEPEPVVNSAASATLGVDFCHHYEFHSRTNTVCHFQFWDYSFSRDLVADVSGLERMVLEDAHACIIVLNSRRPGGLERAMYWRSKADMIHRRSRAGRAGEPLPFFLAVNFVDDEPSSSQISQAPLHEEELKDLQHRIQEVNELWTAWFCTSSVATSTVARANVDKLFDTAVKHVIKQHFPLNDDGEPEAPPPQRLMRRESVSHRGQTTPRATRPSPGPVNLTSPISPRVGRSYSGSNIPTPVENKTPQKDSHPSTPEKESQTHAVPVEQEDDSVIDTKVSEVYAVQAAATATNVIMKPFKKLSWSQQLMMTATAWFRDPKAMPQQHKEVKEQQSKHKNSPQLRQLSQ